MIYLDNAATTYPKPESVLKVLDNANRNAFNTGRGSYKIAREATKKIDEVRSKLLSINSIKEGNVIFTSSATQAINDIVLNIDLCDGDNIYVSPFEHNSIIRVIEQLKKKVKINVNIIPFDKNNWMLNEEKLKSMFVLNKPKMLLLSQVSNVTGYILPYEKIFELAKDYNSINILDASQGYGVVKINDISNINYIVFAGHKSLYASLGIAGFIKLKDDILYNYIFGGTGSDTMNPEMPKSGYEAYEAGSPNIVAIEGLSESLNWLKNINIYEEEKKLTDYLISELSKLKKIKLFIPSNHEKIFGVISFAVNGYDSDEVGKILDDEFEICVRTGFHCAPLVHDFIGSLEYNGTVRCSLSYFSTKDDINKLVEALETL